MVAASQIDREGSHAGIPGRADGWDTEQSSDIRVVRRPRAKPSASGGLQGQSAGVSHVLFLPPGPEHPIPMQRRTDGQFPWDRPS